jgi:hypothetical protein
MLASCTGEQIAQPDPKCDCHGFQFHRPALRSLRACKIAIAGDERGQMYKAMGISRLQFSRFRRRSDCLANAFLMQQHHAELVLEVGIPRIDLRGAPECRFGG